MRTLTERELNRALLARQLLLERARVPVPRALELMGCLQAQYAPSMYIGLWSRVHGFGRHDLTRLLEQRAVVQGTLMRVTIHLVSAGDYWPLALAVREARRALWLRTVRDRGGEHDYAKAAEALRERLRAGPVRRAELDQLVGKGRAVGVGLWIDLVRVPPSGTWERRRADLYAAAEDWLGLPPRELTREAATVHLVRRYLTGFGPATAADAAEWGGLRTSDVQEAMDGMDLRRFATEDGRHLFDLPDAPLPDPGTLAPVRFLPTWDATLLVHARRKGILAEEHRPLVFNTKTPHSVNTFLVDGRVAGTWRYQKGQVTVDAFEPPPGAAREEVAEAAARVAVFTPERGPGPGPPPVAPTVPRPPCARRLPPRSPCPPTPAGHRGGARRRPGSRRGGDRRTRRPCRWCTGRRTSPARSTGRDRRPRARTGDRAGRRRPGGAGRRRGRGRRGRARRTPKGRPPGRRRCRR
ncbi:MAG: winged helix DNA-binding domain-containing protein, partial [Actinomycetota bacterium]|nr:winged helix DNA-binding domain-containing protein [Actinomycetota bacterium]